MYGNGSAANDDKITKVVNFATRVVTGLRKFDHVSRARDDLGLLTARDMYNLQVSVLAHKIYTLGEPVELASQFVTYADARAGDRVTRQDRLWRPPSTRTAAGQRSFVCQATRLLNAMPEDTRLLRPAAFKAAAKMFICDTRRTGDSVT